ncbi:MAG TPA: glycine cleavage system protein GcvH [Pirellulales bacterium]|nr:glycine cleavage system protein GcvH [Pirellulales bacterium]
MTPKNLLYAKTHEWVRVETDAGAKVATIGVTAFALEALTDVTYVELLPKVGRHLAAGEPFGEIESVKAVSDLYSPVAGDVIAVHDGLSENLETLNADPYGEGWMIKVKLTDETSLASLLDQAAYEKQCAEEH